MGAASYVDKDDIANDFGVLFRGGKVALDKDDEFRPWRLDSGGFQPADGKDWLSIAYDHLWTGPSVGVYPLVLHEEEFDVYWGCVDWDTGPAESMIHARNVRMALKQLGLVGWVERSRSKGFHLWVFFTDAVPAVDARRGLIGVCDLVEAPTTEVNPKQVELSGRGWGNGVRLPYGHLRKPGGYNEMTNPEATISILPVNHFVPEAMETRITHDAWKATTALWKRPERPAAPLDIPTPRSGPLDGMAALIRRQGPRPEPDKPEGDRSKALFNLACAMARQQYSETAAIYELKAADTDWGGKFKSRLDGDHQLIVLVKRAYQEVYGA